MPRRDLSSYFARKVSEHVRKSVGNSGFSRGVFEVDETNSNQISLWGDYRLAFIDGGSTIRVVLTNESRDYSGLAKDIREKVELSIPHKYQDIIRDAVFAFDEQIGIDVHPVRRSNTQGRMDNEERLFHALYNVAVRPILAEVLEDKVKR